MTTLISILLPFCLFLLILEIRHYLRPKSPLRIKGIDWKIEISSSTIQANGYIEIINPHKRMEVMLNRIEVKPVLIGIPNNKKIEVKKSIKAFHNDVDDRNDTYWNTYILKSRKSTRIHININLKSDESRKIANILESIWIEINWNNYGPFGIINRKDGFVVPVKSPPPTSEEEVNLQINNNVALLPIKTHILGALDNPYEILNFYTSKIIKPGDILTIGETPLAIMQGRYHYPENLQVSWIARYLCKLFHPTSSLATACGMQSLIDIYGPSKILISCIFGIMFKSIGIKGVFYIIAGEQARLIDDLTGTTPPYDKTIVIGPKESIIFCEKASKMLGVSIAVVDVNDLGRVKIIAASKNCKLKLIQSALKSNPAGNADQHTPIVLIRPSN